MCVWRVARIPGQLSLGTKHEPPMYAQQQLIREGVDAAVYRSERQLPPFHGNLLDYHLQILGVGGYRQDPVNEADAEWCQTHFATFNTLAAESASI